MTLRLPLKLGFLVNCAAQRLAYAPMATQRTDAREEPDGFAVAVVRENATWRCTPMSPKALTSLSAAETELR